MADEKTGTDASNAQNSVSPQDALPIEGSASLPSPEHPPVSHIMPRDPSLPQPPTIETPQKPKPVPKQVASVPPPKPKAAPVVEEIRIEKKLKPKLKDIAEELTTYPSPEHAPVSHIMPKEEIVPTQPLLVPPKPPVTSVMPPPPETKVTLSVPPPPVFPIAKPTQEAHEPAIPAPTPAPAERSKVPTAPVIPKTGDAIADDVGLVMPQPKAKPPDRAPSEMDALLKQIKLPEKRAYKPEGEKTIAPSGAAEEHAKLDEVLSAQITENVVAAHATPESISTTVPDQKVFHEEMEISSVHTLKHDLQHVVQEQKMSVVKAVALEQEKKARLDRVVEPPKPPSRAPSIILMSLLFLALGLSALGGVYYIAAVQSAPGPAPTDTSMVFAEQTVAFPLTDAAQSLRSQLALARTSSGTLGSLLRIVPVVQATGAGGTPIQREATISEFFTALSIEPPESLMRALGDEFFLGVHTVDKNAPIMVIKVVSYDRAFDGMLSWEKNMNGDLAPLYASVPRLMMGADGIQVQRPYTDLVMRNYDVRALKDDDGVIQMYYSFPTRDLLIIAESPYTFTEILSRLQAGRRL